MEPSVLSIFTRHGRADTFLLVSQTTDTCPPPPPCITERHLMNNGYGECCNLLNPLESCCCIVGIIHQHSCGENHTILVTCSLAIRRSGPPTGNHFQHRTMVNDGGISHTRTITTYGMYFLFFILLFISVTRAYIQLNTYTYFSAFAPSLTGLISHYKSDYCKQVKIKNIYMYIYIYLSK